MIARARFVECINSEEIRSIIMTVESQRKVYAMHKIHRLELPFSKMTDIERESKVCGMHKKSRMELRSAIMTVAGES